MKAKQILIALSTIGMLGIATAQAQTTNKKKGKSPINKPVPPPPPPPPALAPPPPPAAPNKNLLLPAPPPPPKAPAQAPPPPPPPKKRKKSANAAPSHAVVFPISPAVSIVE